MRLWLPVAAFTLAVVPAAAAQSSHVVAGPDTISYATYGSGPVTILLVHGWSNNRTFWEPHVDGLSRRYRVVAVDLASFGESTGHRSEWTMPRFGTDLAAVLEEIDAQQAVVVGFSMGGAAALELASLGREELIGVVLVDIFQDPEYAPRDEDIDGIIDRTRRDWRDPTSIRNGLSPRASGTLVRRYMSRTPETVPGEWWESLRNLFVWIRTELRPTLHRVDVPIAAINADHSPTVVEAWQRYTPGFSVHELGDVGHLGSIWERVEEFDEALIGFVEEFRRASRD